MSRIEIDAGGRKVVIEHDGELQHLADTASRLWDHTDSAEPEKPGAAVGFVTGMRYESPPVSQGAYSSSGRPRVTGEAADA